MAKKKGRWWKILLIVLAALILLVISAVHTVLYTGVKDRLIAKFTQPVLEGKVNVDKIRVKLLTTLPDFSLFIYDVSFTWPTEQDTVLAVDRIQAKVNLGSLLKGCIDVHDAGIYGLLARVEPADTAILKPQPPKEKEDKPLDLPWLKADFTLQDTDLNFANILRHGSVEFKLAAQNSREDVLDADLTDFRLKALGVTLDAALSGRDLLGDNPQVDIDADALAKLRALRSLLPEGISADGDLTITADGTLAKSGADLLASVSSPNLRAQLPFGRISAKDVRIEAGACNKAETIRRRRPHREGMKVPEFLQEEDFKASDVDVQLDTAVSNLVKTWNPRGSVHIGSAMVMTPKLPLKNELSAFDASFNTNELVIDTARVVAGNSDLALKGQLKGLRRMLTGRGRGVYRLNLDVASKFLDINQILIALDVGKDADVDTTSAVSDEEYLDGVLSEEVPSEEQSEGMKLFVIPANVIADINLDARRVKYTDITARNVGARIQMKERTVLVTDLKADTYAGSVAANAYYSTKTKQNIGAGFDLALTDVTAEDIIDMIPAVDTLIPILSTFQGKLDATVTATAKLDTAFNINKHSLDGAFFIKGEGLTLDQEGQFKKIARLLMFRDRRQGRIDSLYIGGVVSDNKVRVFPLRLDLDRYSLSLGGVQSFDGDFDYRASMLRWPAVIRFGVRLKGPDFDNIKWRLTKPQFVKSYVPEFRSEVDRTVTYRRHMIRDVFNQGSDAADRAMRQAMASMLKARSADIERADEVEELPEDTEARITGALSDNPDALDDTLGSPETPPQMRERARALKKSQIVQ